MTAKYPKLHHEDLDPYQADLLTATSGDGDGDGNGNGNVNERQRTL